MSPKADPRPINLVCWPTADRAESNVPGSRRVHCSQCRAEVWASPATLDAHARNLRAQVLCVRCFMPVAERHELQTSRAQELEMQRVLGVTAREAYALLGLTGVKLIDEEDPS